METIAAPLPGANVAAPKKRWYRADNIRYLMLFNVIAEHMLTQTHITETWLITVIVCWSRMITMPTFCFISGYFSKKGDKCYQSAIFDFLIPYIIFDTLFALIFGFGSDAVEYHNIFTPTFAYWYMICMFCWKLMTKALQQIKYIVPISIVVALAVGLCGNVGAFLSLSRTIVFLPYYVIGMKMSREDVAKLENLPKLPVFLVTMAVMAVWGYMNVRGVFEINFYYDQMPYAHFGFSAAKGLLFRALGYVVSGVLIVFLYVFVPDRSLPVMRDGGTRTMVPYLLHTYFVINMSYLYAAVPALDKWFITIPIALAMGVFLMWLLGLPALNGLYNDLVSGIKKLLKIPEKA